MSETAMIWISTAAFSVAFYVGVCVICSWALSFPAVGGAAIVGIASLYLWRRVVQIWRVYS